MVRLHFFTSSNKNCIPIVDDHHVDSTTATATDKDHVESGSTTCSLVLTDSDSKSVSTKLHLVQQFANMHPCRMLLPCVLTDDS